MTRKKNPRRRHRTYPRVIKRARHNAYLIKRPTHHGVQHAGPPTIHIRALTRLAAP
jgi:hypothetical protein